MAILGASKEDYPVPRHFQAMLQTLCYTHPVYVCIDLRSPLMRGNRSSIEHARSDLGEGEGVVKREGGGWLWGGGGGEGQSCMDDF